MYMITRPADDSITLAAALEARGIACYIHPLATVAYHAIGNHGIRQALTASHLLVSSRYAAEMLGQYHSLRQRPVLCVGNRTAAICHENGFRVAQLAPTIADLQAAILTMDPPITKLHYCRGSEISGDIQPWCREHTISYSQSIVYTMQYAHTLSPALIMLAQNATLRGAVLCSGNTSRAFLKAWAHAALPRTYLHNYKLFCLGETAAAPLREAGFSPHVSAEPIIDSLIGLIQAATT